jgi:hypothetical protein
VRSPRCESLARSRPSFVYCLLGTVVDRSSRSSTSTGSRFGRIGSEQRGRRIRARSRRRPLSDL